MQVASKLKVLKIAGSKSLIKTPCFSEFMSLERLVLEDLPNLGFSICYLPDSIGNLRLLSRLVVEDTGLIELPSTIKGLADLEFLSLANCTSLNSLPDALGELKSLTELDLSGTTIEELPHSLYNLKDLILRINSSKIRARLARDLPFLEGFEDCLDSIRLEANWESEPKNLKEAHLKNVRQEFMREVSFIGNSMRKCAYLVENSMRKVPLEKVRQKSMNEMPLEKVRQKSINEVPLERVQQKLMLIYEGLEYRDKQIFLDIASIFLSKKKTDAVYIRKGCAKVEIDALVSKSLIKILGHGKVWMHDWVIDFAREIIHQENIEISGDQSRLQFLKLVNGMDQSINVMMLAIVSIIACWTQILQLSGEFDSWDTACKEDWSMATMLDRRNSGMLLSYKSISMIVSFLSSILVIMCELCALRLTWKRDYQKAKVTSMCVMARLIILPSVLSICLLGVMTLAGGKLPRLGDAKFTLLPGPALRFFISESVLPELAYSFRTLVGLFRLLLAWSRLY
ncbi:hypothetical protein EUGRSUZ_K00840 [Eucalyptus grandis]|uniref:Uncharacterized protein n=2 Tax=Eucalyptus grandis TaxID=71139 RepID=A0ACC3IT16_EUCGR|nr:hypothetical protein EUGRSUZ_K00840 [Eucalyptus grandis]